MLDCWIYAENERQRKGKERKKENWLKFVAKRENEQKKD